MKHSSRTPRAGRLTDTQLQTLLGLHRCPTPLHELRMLFLGAIASPRLQVSPMAMVSQAWGGELPEFESATAAEELFTVLIHGLWNRLSQHQSALDPFRLPRVDVEPERQALRGLADMRAQELAAFVDGLFGDEQAIEVPPKAERALDLLSELYSMFAGAADLLANEAKPATDAELEGLRRNLSKLTIAADEQLNAVILACRRARARQLQTVSVARPGAVGVRGDIADEFREDPGDELTERARGSPDAEPYELIVSPLSQDLSHQGVRVRVEIYRGRETGWILEIVDAAGTSHVWDEQFLTDGAALEEALRALESDPLEFAAEGEEGRPN